LFFATLPVLFWELFCLLLIAAAVDLKTGSYVVLALVDAWRAKNESDKSPD
jgi:hypothetical protein